MSLVYCPECGNTVSTAAAACPHCGYPLQGQIDPLEQLASAAHVPTVTYATPMRRQRVTTIEQTSKVWKSQMLSASLVTVAGLVAFFAGIIVLQQSSQSAGGAGPGGIILIAVGAMVGVVGLVWYAFARIGAWWNHG